MPIKGHIFIEGTIKCISGLHVGSASETIEIGGIDSPVVRNPITGAPYIPGSSLKGRMRSTLEKLSAANASYFNRPGGKNTKRHECDTATAAVACCVCRPFGSTGDNAHSGDNHPAFLLVRDCALLGNSIMIGGSYKTEAKMENTLDRVSSRANPRTIERVPADTEFRLNMVYRVDDPAQQVAADLKSILRALDFIEKSDGLGGHVSRGYGQVAFTVTRVEGIRADNRQSAGKFTLGDGKNPEGCLTLITGTAFTWG